MVQNTSHFITTLQREAKRQSSLNQTRFFPQSLDPFTALVGNYPWQILLVLSGITAIVVELAGYVVVK
jgi:hypothetical protein